MVPKTRYGVFYGALRGVHPLRHNINIFVLRQTELFTSQDGSTSRKILSNLIPRHHCYCLNLYYRMALLGYFGGPHSQEHIDQG